jgi:phosphatidate cytidylyltransferase
MTRILTALALLPLALYGTFWAPYWVFVAIVAAVATLCFIEFAGIVAAHGIPRPGWVAGLAGVLVLLNPSPIVIVTVALICLAMRTPDLRAILPASAAAVFGVVYVFGAWRTAIDLRAISPQWLLFALAINWIGDIAAYYTGRSIGRHKLAPEISPGKSWEGAAGSLVAAVAFGLLYRRYLYISVPEMICLALAGNLAGQLGDLAESAMKRGAGLKDSGNLLPGHGGWLDRLDSSLFSMPVVYWIHVTVQSIPR